MGACFSTQQINDQKTSCPYIITSNGQLRQLLVPITVSSVLQSETQSPDSFFLCNSDRLSFDNFIPSLELHEELQPAQVYFILPKSKLQYRLAASDMAALAVKASVALEEINRVRRKSKARISPVFAVEESNVEFDNQTKIGTSFSVSKNYYHGIKATPVVTKSRSVRSLARYSSRRAKGVIRSFKIRLSTISESEGSVHP